MGELPDLVLTVLANGFIIAFLWRLAQKVDTLADDLHYLRGRFDGRDERRK